MNVWLAERYNAGTTELLGVFSDPAVARKVCQDSASEFFGEKNTPELRWLGDDGYASASHHQPVGGNYLFQVTRFIVDQVSDLRLPA